VPRFLKRFETSPACAVKLVALVETGSPPLTDQRAT
jgi:hypothetical protein